MTAPRTRRRRTPTLAEAAIAEREMRLTRIAELEVALTAERDALAELDNLLADRAYATVLGSAAAPEEPKPRRRRR